MTNDKGMLLQVAQLSNLVLREKAKDWEGCLSVPRIRGLVKSARTVPEIKTDLL